jgi:Arc/MetJ-type ribon-helix-helix transcriptional regulator
VVKSYIHARLGKADRALLDELKKTTGHSESELVRRGLRLVSEHVGQKTSALQLAGRSVGRFRKGPRDLSTSKHHLDGFGE